MRWELTMQCCADLQRPKRVALDLVQRNSNVLTALLIEHAIQQNLVDFCLQRLAGPAVSRH